jgi:hypothetical protein
MGILKYGSPFLQLRVFYILQSDIGTRGGPASKLEYLAKWVKNKPTFSIHS